MSFRVSGNTRKTEHTISSQGRSNGLSHYHLNNDVIAKAATHWRWIENDFMKTHRTLLPLLHDHFGGGLAHHMHHVEGALHLKTEVSESARCEQPPFSGLESSETEDISGFKNLSTEPGLRWHRPSEWPWPQLLRAWNSKAWIHRNLLINMRKA